MLNTKKLLYIMPDSAYIAELLPTKKTHSFTIQVFRQINGDFLNDNEFIAENIDKLIKKIDADEYHLVLPDFLFTNTIVDINETSEGEVKKYLKEQLLPSLDLSKETHELDTFILTQHKGKSKVQLSAIEKSLLIPLQKACEEQKVKVSHISPLSWTIKSVISLEPSLSTIQMGSVLYLAQHYIGIDQSISFKIEETDNIVEAVKTLKGAEPNIQTMYLLTNVLVENEIKEKLSGTLPIQQLANYAEEQEGMPAYIKQIIEASAKTLDISDYPVPKFDLGRYVPGAEEAIPAKQTPQTTEVVEEKVVQSVITTEIKAEIRNLDLSDAEEVVTEEIVGMSAEESSLPAPSMPKSTPVVPAEVLKEEAPTKETKDEPKEPAMPEIKEEVVTPPRELQLNEKPMFTPMVPLVSSTPVAPFKNHSFNSSFPAKVATPTPQASVLPLGYMQDTASDAQETENRVPTVISSGLNTPKPKTIIKNKSDSGSLLKIVGITLGALLITVGLGVGIGFGLLSYTQKKGNVLDQTVVASPKDTVSPEESIQPSPSPSPSPTTVAKDKVKILIVNATSIAGKAGKTKSTLAAAGYKTIDTGNAKGVYKDAGTYVLMKNQDESFISSLSKDAGLTLLYNANKDTEDPKGAYDVVIVLNE